MILFEYTGLGYLVFDTKSLKLYIMFYFDINFLLHLNCLQNGPETYCRVSADRHFHSLIDLSTV